MNLFIIYFMFRNELMDEGLQTVTEALMKER